MKTLILPILFVCFLIVGCDSKKQEPIISEQLYCLNNKQNCSHRFADLTIELHTNARVVSPEQLFNIIVSSEALDRIVSVSGYLEGISMYMGKVPLLFKKDFKNSSFIADGFVGSCSDPNMHWRIVLEVKYLDGVNEEQTTQVVEQFYSRIL